MKEILLTLLIAFTTIACKAQNNKAQNDIVDYNNIYINNISIATFKPSDFINTIGKPSSIHNESDLGFNTDVYKKNENIFLFYKNYIDEKYDNHNKGDLILFYIVDYSISVKVNNTTFKVGDNIATLKKVFPKSFNNDIKYEVISILIRGDINGGNWVSDTHLSVEYDKSTDKIIGINLYYPL